MKRYSENLKSPPVPQSQPIPERQVEMVANAAGGFGFKSSDWQRAEKFLILGTEGGTFYESEKDLSKQNITAVQACLKQDGPRLIELVLLVSLQNKAVKQDACIFVLALAAATGSYADRLYAFDVMPQICRTSTAMFNFVGEYKALGGLYSRGVRSRLAKWYTGHRALSYHLVKYRQRDGWKHVDVLRLAHPKMNTYSEELFVAWAAGNLAFDPIGSIFSIKRLSLPDKEPTDSRKRVPQMTETWISNETMQATMHDTIIEGYELVQRATTVGEVVNLIKDYRLPREALPTQWLNEVRVWEVLLDGMPITAMIRNLGVMTALGMFDQFASNTRKVVEQLSDRDLLAHGRVHPISLLLALKVYQNGAGIRGGKMWTPNLRIASALEEAFYASYGLLPVTSGNKLVALDISTSMGDNQVSSVPHLRATEAGAALALAFYRSGAELIGFNTGLVDLGISPQMGIPQALAKMQRLNGGTDTAVPITYALQKRLPVDSIIEITDNESWAGEMHNVVALDALRKALGKPVKFVDIQCTPNASSVADPKDPDTLEIIGFGASVVRAVGSFIGNPSDKVAEEDSD